MRSRASGVARRQNVNKKKIHDKELRGAIRKRVFQTCNAGRAGAQPYRATRRKGHRAKAGAFGYGGQKLELSLTRGKSWSLRLQRGKAGAFAYSGQKLELSLTAGKSWSFRLQGCRRRERDLRVFGDSPAGKEGYQNNCENGGHHAEAKDHKFAGAATEVPRGKGVQPGFPLTTELAK